MYRLVLLMILLAVNSQVLAEDTGVILYTDNKTHVEHAEDEAKAAKEELVQLKRVVGKSPSADDTQVGKPWLPEAKEFDWVQLTSGEWLKGEIKSMYKDSLEFDSDKLDLLNIDWDDVKYLKSYRRLQINIEGHGQLAGDVQVSADKVHVSNDYEDSEYNRSDLISLTPAGNRELDLWAVKFTLSVNLKSGNTRQADYTSRLSLKRRTARSRFLTDYIGNISKTDAGKGTLVETVNNHRLNTSLDMYATRYFYYTPIFAEYYRDPFQNIDQRITAGIGLGYTLLDTSQTEWNVNGGPAYITTSYLSVQADEDRRVNAGALVLGTDFDTELTDTLDFIFKYNIQASKAAAGGYTHHMIATFENELTGRLDFDISLVWDRIGQPTADDTGEEPSPDDYRLTFGITYTY